MLRTSQYGAGGDVQNEDYLFDSIGNLTRRRDLRQSTPFVETFGLDPLNRVTTITTTGAPGVTVNYDDIGNITSRTDVGTFNYGANAGPHALTAVTNAGSFNKTCTHDANGNRTTDGGTGIDYSSANQPVRILKGGDSLHFEYSPGRGLFRQVLYHSDGNGLTHTVRDYVAGLYEREVTSEGVTRHIHYIAGGSGVIAIYTDERSTTTANPRLRYLHKDHLGSVAAITDASGAVLERLSFDAWGRRRTVAYTGGAWQVSYPASPGSAETHRGFTGHEMLDAVGLVHMGGRVYDPLTARFLSPDPFVQSPDNLQNLNRYSYVLNNPLSYTDPSGFIFKGLKNFFKNNWKTIAAVGIGLVTGGAFAVLTGAQGGIFGAIGASLTGSASFTATVAFGIGSGFGSAFSGTLLAGGSVGDALRAGLTGGVAGGVTAGIFKGIDHALPDWTPTFDPNKPLFSAERVLHQVQRMTVRAGAADAIANLEGGKGAVAFRRTLGWDSLGLAQDVLDENQWRSEINSPDHYHAGVERDISKSNQAFATATKSALAKPGFGEAVLDFDANSFGIPWGMAPNQARGWYSEGSSFSNAMSFNVPGLHQISIYHDFTTTVFDSLIGMSANAPQAVGKASRAFSVGSMIPYATFVYGGFGYEAKMRSGNLAH